MSGNCKKEGRMMCYTFTKIKKNAIGHVKNKKCPPDEQHRLKAQVK